MTESPRVTHILREAGLTDFSMVRMDVLEAARKFGSAVHLMTRLWDEGDLDVASLSSPLLPYLDAYRKFCSDYGVSWTAIEAEVRSRHWGFVGHLDRVGVVQAKLTLVDIKPPTFDPAVGPQTAGYALAWREMYGEKIRNRLCVQLTEKKPIVTPLEDKTDEATFLAALHIYRWREKQGRLKNDK